MLAILGCVLVHVPPEEGKSCVLVPIQMEASPVISIIGFGFTWIEVVGSEAHPVAVCVNVNVAVPSDIPNTAPILFTVATAGLLLDHVPLTVGVTVVIAPTQMELDPEIFTVGLALTTIEVDVTDTQLVILSVNVNVAVPGAIAVTIPLLVMVAMLG